MEAAAAEADVDTRLASLLGDDGSILSETPERIAEAIPEEPTEAAEPEAEEPATEPEPEVEAAAEEPDAEAPLEIPIAALAEQNGMDEAALLSALRITDAEGKLVPLTDVVEGWKGSAEAKAIRAQVDQERTVLTEERTALEKMRGEHMTKLAQSVEQAITALEVDRPNWQAMEAAVARGEMDRGELAERKLAWQERNGRIAAALNTLKEEEQRLAAETGRQTGLFALEQERKLFERHPDWNPIRGEAAQKALGAARDSIVKVLADEGFTKEELGRMIFDHRVQSILWEASEYRRMKAGVKDTKAAVTKKLIVLPGRGRSAAQPGNKADAEYTKARSALRKTGNPRHADKLFERYV